MEELLPYLLNLHQSQEGLAEYRSLIHLVGRCSITIGKRVIIIRIMKAIEDWESSSH